MWVDTRQIYPACVSPVLNEMPHLHCTNSGLVRFTLLEPSWIAFWDNGFVVDHLTDSFVQYLIISREITILQIHSLLLWLGERDLSSDCVDVTTFTGETQLPVLSFVAISLQRPCVCVHVCTCGMNAYVAVPNTIPSHIF